MIEKKIINLIDDEKNSIVEFLQQLIRIPSVNGNEKDCALFCAGKLEQMELDVDVWEPNIDELRNHPGFSPTESDYSNRPNVVGVLKGSGGGKSILLNGHVDVVPPGPLDLWKNNPWGAVVKNGKVYGRGAMDMKGGLACMIKVVEILQNAGAKLRGDVIIECVSDEERGGNGTLASIIRGYHADAGIFTEPSGLDSIAIGHRGGLCFRVTVGGESPSVFDRGSGINAIEKMQVVIKAIEKLKKIRKDRVKHPFFKGIDNPVPIYIGTIQGGSWFSSIPLRCTIEGALGWLPNETLESVQNEFKEHIETASRSDPWLRKNLPQVEFPSSFVEPCKLEEDHPIVKVMQNSVKNITGRNPNLIVFNGGADSRLRNLYGKTPSIFFGPLGENAHAPDEYVLIDEVVECTKVLALCIVKWCS